MVTHCCLLIPSLATWSQGLNLCWEMSGTWLLTVLTVLKLQQVACLVSGSHLNQVFNISWGHGIVTQSGTDLQKCLPQSQISSGINTRLVRTWFSKPSWLEPAQACGATCSTAWLLLIAVWLLFNLCSPTKPQHRDPGSTLMTFLLALGGCWGPQSCLFSWLYKSNSISFHFKQLRDAKYHHK